MSSYSLPSRYQPMLGANFFQRQVNSIADALPGVLKKGLAPSPTVNPPQNTGLPDVTGIDKPKSNMLLYAGAGVGGLVLLALLMGRKKRAPKAA
jgi:hypothetical protein